MSERDERRLAKIEERHRWALKPGATTLPSAPLIGEDIPWLLAELRSAQRALDAANQNVKILREQYERVNPSETRGELRAVPSRETSE